MKLENKEFSVQVRSKDAKEAFAAFLEKRAPHFNSDHEICPRRIEAAGLSTPGQSPLAKENDMNEKSRDHIEIHLRQQGCSRPSVRTRVEQQPNLLDAARRLRPEGRRRRLSSPGRHRDRRRGRPSLLDEHGPERPRPTTARSSAPISTEAIAGSSFRPAPRTRRSRSNSIRRTASSTGAIARGCASCARTSTARTSKLWSRRAEATPIDATRPGGAWG